MKIIKQVVCAFAFTCASAASSGAFAVTGKAPGGASPAPASASSSSGSRTFILTMPVAALSRDHAYRVEFNTGGASLALEGATMGEAEEVSEESQILTGDSMVTNARQAAFLVSRFTNPGNMSGWFWTLGAGVRQMSGAWRTDPSAIALFTRMPLVQDPAGKVYHRYTATGATGHARVGYRWVSQAIPLSIGAQVGVRHFDGKYEDVETLGTYETPLAIDEKSWLRRHYMTHLEPAVELGLAF